MPNIKRPLKVFLYHAPLDKLPARDLYLRLIKDGVDTWMVKERLLPGQDWKLELESAVREADVVLVCVSQRFQNLESREKEARTAFDSVLEQLDREMFVITVRLEACDLPENLMNWQRVDLFETDGYERLMQALKAEADEIGVVIQAKESLLPQSIALSDTNELPVPDEKPVDLTHGKLEIIEGAGVLIEDPAVKGYKRERGILLALLGFASIVMMAWLGPSWIEMSNPATMTPTVRPTQTSAPATRVSTEPIPISTLTGRGNVSHIIFLIDTSGSMQGQRLRNVKSAASQFASRLASDYLISVIGFDTQVELRMASARDHTAAGKAIESLNANVERDGSCAQDALSAGFQQSLRTSAGEEGRALMIILNDVAIGDHVGENCGIRLTYESLNLTLTYPVPIFSVYVGDDFLANRFAVYLGGEGASLPAQSEQKIESILLSIAQAAGLELKTESATPAPTTDARPLSMVFVPQGDFLMGTNTVYLDSFWIDKTEVTNSMYAGCVQAGNCNPPRSSRSNTRESYYGNPQFSSYPVVYVSWLDANAYCAWTGGRLPTEAEWEKAARGTDGRLFPWGDVDPTSVSDLLNFHAEDTSEVGTYPAGASPYGALDMAGNVSEWVADWFSLEYYNSIVSPNPLGPESGEYRVWRGGSFANTSTDRVRTYARTGNFPTDASGGIGFRCAREAWP